MARVKGAIRLISQAAASREFGLTWDQVHHLIRKFKLEPIPVSQGDGRSKYAYRYADVKRLCQEAPRRHVA